MPDTSRHRSLELPWATLFKVLAALALVWATLQLVPMILLVVVSAMLAVTLDPLVRDLQARGFGRTGAAAIVSLVALAVVVGFLWMTWASLSDQGQYVATHIGSVEHDLTRKLPGWMRDAITQAPGADLSASIGSYAARVGRSATWAVAYFVLGFVLTIFLLIEGCATYQWLLAFVPKRHRARTHRTADECQRVIFAYWKGNIITSVIATVCTLVALWILKVPAALMLALMAGLSDFVPVIGFIVSSIPAVLLAMTISTKTTVIVVLFYIGYNTVESYLISPWAYGSRMKLSNTAVILAFAVGAQLAGVIGALIALPVAAMYPVVERIWLREALGDDVVDEHKAAARKIG